MNEITMSLLVLWPVIESVAVTTVFWRKLINKPLFLVISTLALLGLQSLCAPVATGVFLPRMGGVTAAVANQAFIHTLLLGVAIQLVVGLPLLFWLKHALHKP